MKFGYKFHITLQKTENFLIFASNNLKIYSEFCQILKKFCILEQFTQKYELVKFLGSGFFAEVHLAKVRATNELFAAKIIKKTDKKFIHNKVFCNFSFRIKL